MFDYVDNLSASPRPCTRQDFDRIIDAQRVKTLIDRIAVASTVEEVAKLKRLLPAFCFHAHFTGGRRANSEAVPSGLVMLDIDHVEGRVDSLWGCLRTTFMDLGGLLAHKTPSGHGLRLVMPMPAALSDIADAQAYYARRLGLGSIDTCTRDLARLSFAVSRAYVYYVNSRLFTPLSPDAAPAVPSGPAPRPLQGDVFAPVAVTPSPGQPAPSPEKSAPSSEVPAPSPEEPPAGAASPAALYPDTFQGLPYWAIVRALEDQLGGRPEHGARNHFILSMASYLRHVCDDDEEWVAAVLPDYGEARPKWRRTVKSACSYPLAHYMPRLLRRALQCARRDYEAANAMAGVSPQEAGGADKLAVADGADDFRLPPMPDRLPPLIAHLVSKVPDFCRPAVAHAVFPALGAHLGGVKFRYVDNVDHEATFMCVLMAPMSSGKSCVNKPIEHILADIMTRDEVARKREREWKELCAKQAATKDKPPRPGNLCVQVLVSDMTNAAFVQRLNDASGQFLYTSMDEIELLNSLQTNHRTGQVSQILRLAFDCGYYGQERVSAQSVTARVRVKWNWNASTTVRRGQRFFEKSLADGTLSRLNLCTIVPPPDGRMPVIGTYDDLFAQQLQPYIARLNHAFGRITCTEAEKLARRMAEENAERAALSGDEVFGQLAYRANVIAYLKGMVLYLAHDCSWTPEIEAFVRWSEEYDLQCKMGFFGEMMERDMEGEVTVTRRGPSNMLALLPDRFTRADVEALRRRAGLKTGAAPLVRVWLSRNYIARQPDGIYFTKLKEF